MKCVYSSGEGRYLVEMDISEWRAMAAADVTPNVGVEVGVRDARAIMIRAERLRDNLVDWITDVDSAEAAK